MHCTDSFLMNSNSYWDSWRRMEFVDRVSGAFGLGVSPFRRPSYLLDQCVPSVSLFCSFFCHKSASPMVKLQQDFGHFDHSPLGHFDLGWLRGSPGCFPSPEKRTGPSQVRTTSWRISSNGLGKTLPTSVSTDWESNPPSTSCLYGVC